MALDVVLGLAAGLACWLGFALMALSQERHWEAVCTEASAARPVGPRIALASGVLLAVALGLSIASQGPSFGSLLWVVMVSAAAFTVAFTLSWRPQALRPLGRLMGKL